MPPSKKRMFDDNDYTQLVNGILPMESDGLPSHCADDNCLDDDGDDIVELDYKFTMNYWHKPDMDLVEDDATEIELQLDRRILIPADQVDTLFFC